MITLSPTPQSIVCRLTFQKKTVIDGIFRKLRSILSSPQPFPLPARYQVKDTQKDTQSIQKENPEAKSVFTFRITYLYQYLPDLYLYAGFREFASSTIFLIPSSGKLPFLNSARISGYLDPISIKKCSSNAFTFLTGTSLSKPCVPR